jgi:amino acid transporter
MADKVHISREVPGSASAPSGEGSSHQFGLTAAMALIVGSIIGVGIFNLPTSLAVYAPITLVSMALTTVGALVLALLFAALSRRLPRFWVYWAPFFLAGGALLLGIPVYLGQRRHMSQPAPVPPYREVERGG